MATPTIQYRAEVEKTQQRYDYYNPVYKIEKNDDGTEKSRTLTGIRFDHLKIAERLQELGYCSHEINGQLHLLRIRNRRASTTDADQIARHVGQIFKQMPDELPDGITRNMVLREFYKSEERFFRTSLYKHLESRHEITFYEDDQKTAFFFYENCIVEVTAQGIRTHQYDQQVKTVWESQILKRNYTAGTDARAGNWYQFVSNIAGPGDRERLFCLQTIIGYLLHKYYDRKLQAIGLTDGRITDSADGRSGKSLLAKGIGHMLNGERLDKVYVEISGKTFDVERATKYELADLDTRLIHLNDIITSGRLALQIDRLFNDITDGTQIRHLYRKPFTIFAKFLLTYNSPLKIHGGSARARIVEMELSNHYGEHHSPQDEFKEWFFSDDWTAEAWAHFDAFMLESVQCYLSEGLQQPSNEILGQRKLLAECGPELCEFLDDLDVTGERIRQKLSKKQMYEQFIEQHNHLRHWMTPNQFTKRLKLYCDYHPDLLSYHTLKISEQEKARMFHPRNVMCDVCLDGSASRPSGDAFIFYPADHPVKSGR